MKSVTLILLLLLIQLFRFNIYAIEIVPKIGLIDKQGNIITIKGHYMIPINLKEFSNLIPVRNFDRKSEYYDKIGYMNYDGVVVITPKFSSATEFINEHAIVSLIMDQCSNKFKYGVINKKGDWCILPEYDYIEYYNGYYYSYKTSNVLKNMVLNKVFELPSFKSPIVDNGNFDNWYFSQYNLKVINVDKLFGLTDNIGKQILNVEYTEIGKFSCNRAIVIKNKLSGYIDKSGNMIIPCQYNLAYDFKNNVAYVEKEKKGMIIDLNGKVIIEIDYSEFGGQQVEDNIFFSKKISSGVIKMGIMKTSGEWIIKPMRYDKISAFYNNMALAKIDSNVYIIDDKQEILMDISSKISDFELAGFKNEKCMVILK